MHSPKLLLLDEPLSALDATMRQKLQRELRILHKEFSLTTIMVSHDAAEIYNIADRVLLLEDGKILKDGTPQDIVLKKAKDVKLSFDAEVIELVQKEQGYFAVVVVKQVVVEVSVEKSQYEKLEVGMRVEVGAKEFVPTLV